jgi:hypothetical protein
MRISAFSSNLRRRAAQDAPPATAPTITTFTGIYLLSFPNFGVAGTLTF